MEKITGIILAGGKSRRMGENKAILKIKNKTLIEMVFDQMKKVCDEIIISSNTNEYDFLKAKNIKDIYENIGGIGGIYSSLKNSNNEKNLIISCDTPFINYKFLEFLIKKSGNYEITICKYENQIQYLIGIYQKKNIIKIKEEILKKNYSLRKIISKFNCQIIEINSIMKFFNKNLFANLNTKKDYLKYKDETYF